jgi:hypothetical protein
MPLLIGGLVLSFILGLILPLIGTIITLVYCRILIVRPFRQYIPVVSGLITKWLVRILIMILLFTSIVPVTGAFIGPLIVLLCYGAWRGRFKGLKISAARTDEEKEEKEENGGVDRI